LQFSSPRCSVPSEISPAVRYIGEYKDGWSLYSGQYVSKFLNGGQPSKKLSKKEKSGWMVNPQFG